MMSVNFIKATCVKIKKLILNGLTVRISSSKKGWGYVHNMGF